MRQLDTGFEVCEDCGRERRSRHVEPVVRRCLYKCVHYMQSLLKAYELRDRKPPPHVMRVIRGRWLAAGSPPPTKLALQRIMRTRHEPELRPYLRKWRHVAYELCGVRPPPLSTRARAQLLVMFSRVHRAWARSGMYRERKSFMSFPFTLRRCLERLGLDAYKEYFPGLRGKDKYALHYGYYRRVCRYLREPVVVAPF